jgi:hypothetical protein
MATNPIGLPSTTAAPQPVVDQRTELPVAQPALVSEESSDALDPSNQAILAADHYDDDASELPAGTGISAVVGHLASEHDSGL